MLLLCSRDTYWFPPASPFSSLWSLPPPLTCESWSLGLPISLPSPLAKIIHICDINDQLQITHKSFTQVRVCTCLFVSYLGHVFSPHPPFTWDISKEPHIQQSSNSWSPQTSFPSGIPILFHCTLSITGHPEASLSFTPNIPTITQFYFLNLSQSHPIFSTSTMPTSPGPT